MSSAGGRVAAVAVASFLALAGADAASAATFTVTSNADSGAGTLREQITLANASVGADVIAFAVGTGAITIAPASALPAITEAVSIDGTTQPGVGTMRVELDGSNAGTGANGLTVASGSGTVIKGLVVNDFVTSAGISVGADATTISANWIGTDASTGATAHANGRGITVLSGGIASIGGTGAGDGNVISGNLAEGVSLQAETAAATLQSNLIGTTANGAAGLGNGAVGVLVNGVAASATIGTTTAGNVISANGKGILVASTSTATIQNNVIGLAVNGTTALGNLNTGISVGGSAIVTIGGASSTLTRNVISANGVAVPNGVGVELDGTITEFANNYVGTDITGTVDKGNTTGVRLLSTGTLVGGSTPASRNVISGNDVGVAVAASADGATIVGNWIGVKADGSGVLANGSRGIALDDGATGVTVGGSLSGAQQSTVACDGPCNTISGSSVGVAVAANATGATIAGNLVGTDPDGLVAGAFANATGITIAAANATIGGIGVDGVAPAGRNVIGGRSGTTGISTSGSTANLAILGNRIGLLGNGTTAAGGTTGVRLGGSGAGIALGGTLSAAALATAACDGACNLITASSSEDVQVTNATVRGNRIGTTSDGSAGLGGPAADGIDVTGGSGTIIGGAALGDRNLISGHGGGAGVRVSAGAATVIQGNDIGTAAGGGSAVTSLRNDVGVYVEGGTATVVGGEVAPGSVGGACDHVCNVISNNFTAGVRTDKTVTGVVVAGNHIGLDRSGTVALGNTVAGVSHRATGTALVGGTSTAARNVISANGGGGVETNSLGTGLLTVRGNYIGTAADGATALGNGGAGIEVATGALIGGSGASGNRIAFNTGDGVFVAPEATGITTVAENEIFGNDQLGIDLGVDPEPDPGLTANDAGDLDSGGNGLQNYPSLSAATLGFGGSVQLRGVLDSASSTTYAIRLYVNDACDAGGRGEAARFVGVGSLTTGSGPTTFAVSVPVTGTTPVPGQLVTATASDPAGRTSELSQCVEVKTGVRLAAASATVAENAGSATITVERAATAGTTTVRVDTVDGGTAAPGSDYTPIQQVVQFADGVTTATATVPLLDDASAEGAETVNLALTVPGPGLDLGSPAFRDAAGLTITDDEAAPTPPTTPGTGTTTTPRPGTATSSPLPSTGAPAPASATVEHLPDSDLGRLPSRVSASRLRTIRGTASDRDEDLARVEVALVRVISGARAAAATCVHYTRTGRTQRSRPVAGRCVPRFALRATGTSRWTVRLPRKLGPGTWTVYSRAVDLGGRLETTFTTADRNRRTTRIVGR